MVAASTILQLTVTYTPSDPPSSTGFPCGARVFLLVLYYMQLIIFTIGPTSAGAYPGFSERGAQESKYGGRSPLPRSARGASPRRRVWGFSQKILKNGINLVHSEAYLWVSLAFLRNSSQPGRRKGGGGRAP